MQGAGACGNSNPSSRSPVQPATLCLIAYLIWFDFDLIYWIFRKARTWNKAVQNSMLYMRWQKVTWIWGRALSTGRMVRKIIVVPAFEIHIILWMIESALDGCKKYVMQNTTVKTGRGCNWLWAFEKVMVPKRVISACARVTNLLEVLWGCLLSHRHTELFSSFMVLVRKSDDKWHWYLLLLLLNVDLTAAERRQDLRALRRGQLRSTFPPPTGVAPPLHESP